jgi:hypothetical protein
MKPLSTVIAVLVLTATLVPQSANAQTGTGQLTKDQLTTAADDLGSVLRFRQLGATTTLPKGKVDLGVQFGSSSLETPNSSWNHTRFAGRFGVSDRMDVGVWGGNHSASKAAIAGIDTKILLVKQSATAPVSIAVRPSLSSILGTADIWAASVGFDVSVSRTFGALAPYAGVGATSTFALERMASVDLGYATAGRSVAFAGVVYTWRSLVTSAEVESGAKTSYAVRIGTRF